jgi:hypothetical protein
MRRAFVCLDSLLRDAVQAYRVASYQLRLWCRTLCIGHPCIGHIGHPAALAQWLGAAEKWLETLFARVVGVS